MRVLGKGKFRLKTIKSKLDFLEYLQDQELMDVHIIDSVIENPVLAMNFTPKVYPCLLVEYYYDISNDLLIIYETDI